MKEMIEKLKKMSLIKKIITIYTVVVIFPVFMLVSYLSMVQYEKLYTETVSSKQLALEQLTQNIQNSLATVETLSQNLAYRSPISSLISRNNLENFPIWTKRSSNEIIDALHYTLKYQNRGIEDIDIYTNKNELCNQENFYNISLLYGFDFYDNFHEQQKGADFYFLDKETTEKYFAKKDMNASIDELLLFVRDIRNEEDDVYSGLLVFEIDPEKFLLSLQENKRNEYSIYFTNTKDFWGKPLSTNVISAIQSSVAENTVNFSEVSFGHLYSYIKNYKLVVIDRNAIEKNSYIILTLRIFVLFSLLIVVQALCLHILIKYIMNKINKNINEMDRIVANGFEGQIPVDECDEFRTITMRYNVLLNKIQTLISDMIKKESDKKEAQIKALQYQMNPHFIYNIKNTGMFATVKEEMDNAYSLVQVYSIRCEGNLELELDVPQELYPVEIIKYLLQPILENSIVHGAKKNQRTWIRIKARYFGKFLVIKIEDNGTGVDKEYLEKIRENIVEGKQLENTISSNSSFIGLRNIYKRLQLIYGEEAELLIDSKIEEGTVVSIKIPIKDFEESE